MNKQLREGELKGCFFFSWAKFWLKIYIFYLRPKISPIFKYFFDFEKIKISTIFAAKDWDKRGDAKNCRKILFLEPFFGLRYKKIILGQFSAWKMIENHFYSFCINSPWRILSFWAFALNLLDYHKNKDKKLNP